MGRKEKLDKITRFVLGPIAWFYIFISAAGSGSGKVKGSSSRDRWNFSNVSRAVSCFPNIYN